MKKLINYSNFFKVLSNDVRIKILFELAFSNKAKIININIPEKVKIFIENNLKVKFIKGENLNNKITFKEDIETNKTYFGIGFDIHRLIKDKKLFLGGIKIPYHSGLKGHSDGDVIIHAIITN